MGGNPCPQGESECPKLFESRAAKNKGCLVPSKYSSRA